MASIIPTLKKCVLIVATVSAWPVAAQDMPAQPTQEAVDPLQFSIGSSSVKVSIEAGTQILVQSNSYWNLSDTLAPTEGFATDPVWGEGYVKTGIRANHSLGFGELELGVSAIAAQTLGRDVFGEKNRGRLVLENAYASLRIDLGSTDRSFTVSGGAQPYQVGNGMLLSDGAVDGFERGALIFGPRKAWANSAIARLQLGRVTLAAFHLNPRELRTGDTHTLINGGQIEFIPAKGQTIGVAYGHVPRSEAPYIQAAPGGVGFPSFLFNGRNGLSFWHGWFRISPIASMPGFFIAGDYANQRNSRIQMKASGGRIEVGNTFLKLPWRPTLTYSYQSLSGDDPDTPELERFDPLFYDGGQGGWASGTNGSFVFINSNVNAHRLALVSTPSPRDILSLRYAAINVNNLRSPIQFGQATRPNFDLGAPGLVAGVTKRHLSDDILIEYTRIVSQNVFVTAGFAHSWAGSGLKTVTTRLKGWSGAFLNVVLQY